MPNAPQPPADFDDAAKKTWRSSLKALRDQGTWQDSDRDALERYCRAVSRARGARAVVASEGLTAVGSTGQPVTHPAVRIAREAERDAAEYARDLLLTPRARRTAGVAETTSLEDELAELVS
jgi:P27 family predicted phage terminase small subunit